MDKKRRLFLQSGMVAGGLGAFAAGYQDPLKLGAKGFLTGTSGTATKGRITGNALTPEFRIDSDGELHLSKGQAVSPVQCFGCWTLCGLRARVDLEENKILRIAGNPYHPLSNTQPPEQTVPVREVYKTLAAETGIEQRSTACARGAALGEQLQSPFRVTQILKRAGKRGEGKWQSISFEQLIQEVTEGGNLFGEGHVDGLKAIRDLNTPVDANNPEYGPKANQLLFTNAGNEGRDAFTKRFAFNSFGTRNFGHHGSYCGSGFRTGSGAVFNDLQSNAHGKPDWDHAEFVLCIGTSPAQAGNPFKRQGRQLAQERSEGKLEYVVVAPSLPNSISRQGDQRGHWVPVKPATDDGLALAIIRWLFENDGINRTNLSIPNAQAQKAAGEPCFSNATHLVIQEPHPQAGRLLSMNDAGLSDSDEAVVLDSASGQFVAASNSNKAELFVEAEVNGIAVKSALQCLKESALEHSLAEYSDYCGVPINIIEGLGKKLKKHGRKASVDAHGGMMSGNSFYTAMAVMSINALLGNTNAKGGLAMTAGGIANVDAGPRYKLNQFSGKVEPKGVFLSRSRFPYEKSSEYKRKQAAGEPVYPSKAPWFAIPGPLLTEHLASAFAGYPYPLKAWISHMTNPLYGINGASDFLSDKIKDPKQLPLFIAIDGFINETTALADYIVPDTLTYESWGFTTPWSGVPQKATTCRWPVVEPATPKLANGDYVGLESFLIHIAKALDLPGFGDKAIEDHEGNWHGLHRAQDYYLRATANLAYAQGKAVPQASIDDLILTNAARWLPAIEETLAPQEQLRAGFVLSRGGRFSDFKDSYQGEQLTYGISQPLCIWNPKVGQTVHSISGQRLSGCAKLYGPRFMDGSAMRDHFSEQEWPFLVVSYKSHLMSSSSIGSQRLRSIHPENPVSIHRQDADKLGIKHGQPMRVSTPNGQIEGIALVRDGIMPGVIAVEHGYGHSELGARVHHIDGQAMAHDPKLGAGVNLNQLGVLDPTRKEVKNVWLDWVCGSSVRQGLPAKVEKA